MLEVNGPRRPCGRDLVAKLEGNIDMNEEVKQSSGHSPLFWAAAIGIALALFGIYNRGPMLLLACAILACVLAGYLATVWSNPAKN